MRDNTNPIYLQEFLGLGLAAAAMGTSGLVAGGIKAARIEYNTRKVMKQYPTPQDMIDKLSEIHNNSNAIKYISILKNIKDLNEYKMFIRKYICGNTAGSWLATLFLPFAAPIQAVKGISDLGETGYDTFRNGLN